MPHLQSVSLALTRSQRADGRRTTIAASQRSISQELLRRKPVVAVALVALAVAGCGGASQQTSSGRSGKPEARASSPSQGWDAYVRPWRQQLLAAADKDKDVKFPTPSQAAFEKKLAAAASQFGFRVLSVEFVRAPQGSPLVIVEASSPTRFSQDTPAIVRRLDPRRGSGEDWQGWDYEGFFLGAQDQQGEPFVAVFNFMRDHGGGQWARSEGLYPFPHL
jgi:hypothetical protein